MSWEAVAITAAIRGAKDFFSYAQKHPEVYVVGAVLGGAFFLVWWSERKKIISPSVSKKAPEHKDALTEILERTPERNLIGFETSKRMLVNAT